MADIVTARVPLEIRRQGNDVLKRLGSTPTQLVNAAYEYVIAKGELPVAHKRDAGAVDTEDGSVVRRVLNAAEARELTASIGASTLDIPEDCWDDGSYRDAIAEGRWADYEALA